MSTIFPCIFNNPTIIYFPFIHPPNVTGHSTCTLTDGFIGSIILGGGGGQVFPGDYLVLVHSPLLTHALPTTSCTSCCCRSLLLRPGGMELGPEQQDRCRLSSTACFDRLAPLISSVNNQKKNMPIFKHYVSILQAAFYIFTFKLLVQVVPHSLYI